jgi:hypothetical protein
MSLARAALALWCLVGCARDLHTQLPGGDEGPTGSLLILFTRPTRDVSVAVNGTLVADDAHTERLRVERVPVGEADVVVAAGAGDGRVERHVRVRVGWNEEIAIPLAAPSPSIASTLSLALLSLAVVAARVVMLGLLY